MKIKTVKMFQAVHINGSAELSVQCMVDPVGKAHNAQTNIEITEVPNGLTFRKKGSNSVAFTTWNNIQYVIYDDTPEVQETSKAPKAK